MNAKAFFLRFDVVRKVSRALLVMLLLLLFLARSWQLGTFGISFFAVSLILTVCGSSLRTVKDYKLSEFISESRHLFETEVKKENKSFRHGDPVVFYAYGKERAALARALGRRLIYPVCFNMMFLRHGKGGTLIIGKTSLWVRERPTKEKYRFSEMKISFVRMEGDAEILHATFFDGERECLSFFVRDDHFWRAFLSYAGEGCTVLEETD